MMHRRIHPVLGLSLFGLALCGCAEERAPINRVQANALSKEFFVGALDDPADDPEFFTRNLVIDASESQELVGISSASGLERIRWHITESTLFARRAYSVTEGDNKGTSVEPNGDIIAAYKIDSHFDIRRDYNSSTGEELNVIVENESDRPWHEREYFRVDWSENLVDTPVWQTMFFGKTFGSIKLTPVAYYESDADSDDAPHFEPESGYFDITSHFLVEPETVQFFDFELPLCFVLGLYTGSAIYSCNPQEAVVRSSYWRVDEADPDGDFEPFENTEAQEDIFGNPGGLGASATVGLTTPPRENFDPGYGFTDVGLRRYMNIHNLWEQSHQTIGSCEEDADCERITGRDGALCLDSGTCSIPCNYEAREDTDQNGTDDQCENSDTNYDGSRGSQCSARDRCTIPYRDRTIQPVAYTVNPEMPEELQDRVNRSGDLVERGANEDLIETWNQALQLAVARAREVECRRTGQGEADALRRACHERYFEVASNGDDEIQMIRYGGWGAPTPKQDEDALVLCHNPVRSYDPSVCGTEGNRARVGDLRRNFLIYWPYNTQAPYGGIGNWRGDPLTGQILGAAATTIGRSTTFSAAQVRDLALVALGELDFDEITQGISASRFQRELRDGRKPEALRQEDIERRVQEYLSASSTSTTRPDALDEASSSLDVTALAEPRLHLALQEVKAQTSANPELLADTQLRVQAAAAPILGTSLEADMVTPNWLVDALGVSPNSQVTNELLDQASPLRGLDMGMLSYLDRRVSRDLGLRGVCHLDHMASIGSPDIHGLGPYFRDKYPDLSGAELAEAIYLDLWKDVYKGIQLHEIGHSLGLLHNFASSFDSLNYNPQYWQLRTHEGDSITSCNGVPRTGDPSSVAGDSCMGPRYLDPETDDELGLDDEPRPGLAYFAHTSTMEYQNTRFFETVGLGQYDVMTMGALYGRVLETFDPDTMPVGTQHTMAPMLRTQLAEEIFLTGGTVHYTELGRRIGIFDPSRCRDATRAEIEHAEWRIVHGKVCLPPAKDIGHWDDFVDSVAFETENGPVTVTGRKVAVPDGAAVAAAGNVRWPYRFGGDINNSYPHINPFDSGADLYEVTQETIRKNDYEYPLNYFRRLRRGWDERRLPSRTASSFYERLRSYHWGVSFTGLTLDSIRNEFIEYNPEAIGRDIFGEQLNDDNAFRPGILAQHDMLHAIARMLLKPEPGAYWQEPNADGVLDLLPFWAPDNAEQFPVDAADGRFLAPDYDSGPRGGGSWQYLDYANYSGYSVEKSLAARALTDSRPVLSIIARSNYLDRRDVFINFRTSAPDAVDRLLGGILSEHWSSVGPYYSQQSGQEVNYRELGGGLASLPGDAQVLFPNVGYNQQVPTMIFAQLFGRLNGNLGLSNKLRVWLDGSLGGDLNVPEAEQVRFTDPASGLTYIARLYGSENYYGESIDRGIGSRMLQRANELLTAAYEVETDEDGAIVVDEFQRPTVLRDEDGDPIQAEDQNARDRFRDYVGVLDAAARISSLFGHGPF